MHCFKAIYQKNGLSKLRNISTKPQYREKVVHRWMSDHWQTSLDTGSVFLIWLILWLNEILTYYILQTRQILTDYWTNDILHMIDVQWIHNLDILEIRFAEGLDRIVMNFMTEIYEIMSIDKSQILGIRSSRGTKYKEFRKNGL